ncbi:DNA topoisomerase IV subunit A [Clostridium botulinum C]|uniref:DNA topoisomerase (ATP-hydrolyzing) n=2 Tax=Clostridium botulinum TaxID=1491 RepID=A0A9Q4THZ1_CLOBO|nr:DNA topoisomerase IV subunit A [Clostridium botulinum]MCD3194487.1 DNA topoisomerase IV subunit A [Clostridium botulinum C]MCD3199641.1 DNA topoisomerase IV subunit A [Clostridium botulinum C]MCD3205116.1 DNA topoisomerase IV subunit A [Clostridium botulinum C]MCD3209228.1 DNA topoisomerase IV subunit A [Clostridium botulinum C]MCD3225399.1 DNA topoisomerase IV subunit A [Clostridium botulinum C]
MSKKYMNIPKDNNIIKTSISEVMPENYLPYAVEVAKERALPDVRDGLKPVHRRILYGAYKLKATPDKPYYKSARIVGDILGKYHPHGDTSVYDAMVILAQDFTTRIPLIDGHGNWGSIDGDNAAAMRYTEARLTNPALEMLRDIDKDVVDMVSNYSDTELEPKVLPARFPNLLVNGAFGIAVGLATNIPPHNLRESIDATVAYIDNNDISTKELMNYIKGPDLPTGGIIIGEQALFSAYEKGEGRVTLRAKTSIEKLENDRYGIIIKEFPYRKNKSKILQTISEMTADKKHSKALENITDIRDESDRNGIRAVIEFKKSASLEVVERVLKYLFKKTELQCNISFNMVAIADGKPETLGLKAILKYYVEHQKEVVIRRSEKELEIAKKRFHIVEGFIKAIDIMDKILDTIRSSKSKKDSEQNLVNKFGFSMEQAQAIVELMLYKLTGLEIKVFEKEYKNLEKEIKALEKILSSEKELFKVVKKELEEVKEKYGDPRRTEIVHDDEQAKIDIEELILDEDIVITLSNEGYIKRVADKYYRRINPKVEDIEYRDGDFNTYLLNGNTKDNMMIFTDEGNLYQIRISNIPEMKWKEKGERLDTLIKALDIEKEKIIDIYITSELLPSKSFMFFTNRGVIKKSSLDKFKTNYSKLLALKLKDNEKLIDIKLVNTEHIEKYISVITKNGLSFTVDIPRIEDSERNIMGTQIFNISDNDEVKSIKYIDKFDMKNFVVNINKNGNIKISNRINHKNFYGCYANSLSRLIIFGEKGNVYYIPAYMIQNIDSKGIKLNDLIDDFKEKEENIVNIYSISEFSDSTSVYFFTKSGYVKRTNLQEFNAENPCIKGYKLKKEQDKIINVLLFNNDDKKDIILITKNAMGIRFEANSISYMGKIASGVTGISLRDNDEVIFAQFIDKKEEKDIINICGEFKSKLNVECKDRIESEIILKNIKNQNRAGKGKKLINLELDDYIKSIK